MTRNLHITLTARDIHEEELRGKVVVVIDVLRATSVIITALSNGARWVKTVASIEEAFQLKSSDVLLGGERHALPIDGFDFSNSPLDYTVEKVRNKGIVLTTTNGTLALSKCGSADEVLIGAFINYRALTNYLSAQNQSVELICAGTNGEFSLDDFLCAGLICSTLQKSGGFEFDDLGRLAIQSWKQGSSDIHAALSGARHYNVLKSKGFDLDLDYCLKRDTHNVLVRRNTENQFITQAQ
ncbi:MAG: 2-phosphosulfolactate phosphatase [Porphyromonadaceae bacterium]|nr:MAG: 2-phosphosulfolactate phosphatase [Porphyromonadaceae bacterium]